MQNGRVASVAACQRIARSPEPCEGASVTSPVVCLPDARWDRMIRRPSTIRMRVLFGHDAPGTTIIYAHALDHGVRGVSSSARTLACKPDRARGRNDLTRR